MSDRSDLDGPTHDRTLETADLPATRPRDGDIAARCWTEAPQSLKDLGADLPDHPESFYMRRIGPWLLWRAGPPSRGDTRYWAAKPGMLHDVFMFRLNPDGSGEGTGPSGVLHHRLRPWKEDLRDNWG